MGWLLSREACVTFAVVGAVLSTSASILQARRMLSARNAQWMNYAGYGAMGVSMLAFIVAGFMSPA